VSLHFILLRAILFGSLRPLARKSARPFGYRLGLPVPGTSYHRSQKKEVFFEALSP
jgi:hypothetical protein